MRVPRPILVVLSTLIVAAIFQILAPSEYLPHTAHSDERRGATQLTSTAASGVPASPAHLDIRHPGTSIAVRLVSVIDGDTVIIDTPTRKGVHVRLLGINSPETSTTPYRTSECGGDEARDHLKTLTKPGDALTLILDSQKVDEQDKYGRTLGYLTPHGTTQTLNETMVLDGYAREYTYHNEGYDLQSQLKELESGARKNAVGLWPLCY